MYQLHAIKHGELKARRRGDLFVGGDPHDGRMDMDYFIWVAIGDDGASASSIPASAPEVGARRGRRFLRSPAEALAAFGVDAARVQDVVLTHLHNDHAGSFGQFPNARFHLQDREMAFATGRADGLRFHARRLRGRRRRDMVRAVYDERVVFHDGDAAIAARHRAAPHRRATRAAYSRSVWRPRVVWSCWLRCEPLLRELRTRSRLHDRRQRCRRAGGLPSPAGAGSKARADRAGPRPRGDAPISPFQRHS